MNPRIFPCFLAAALLLTCHLLPVASLAQAEDGLPGSEPAVTPAEVPPPPVTDPGPEAEALKLQAQADKARYEQVIADLDSASSGNNYSTELSEAYLNLAGTLEVLGQYEEAIAVYDQALQTIRIGNGLYSLQQIPVLEALQENSLKLADWESVDRYSGLVFHIALKNFPVGDPRRARAIDRQGLWKLRAANEELTGNYRQLARDTVALYTNELELLEAMPEYENKGIHLAMLHLGEARAKLTIAQQVLDMPLGNFRTSGQQTITTQRCRAVRVGDRVTQICETVEVPNMDYYLDPSVRKGQEISQNLLDIRRSVTTAFEELQKDGDVDQRNALLAEMQELTKAYNAFVTSNGL